MGWATDFWDSATYMTTQSAISAGVNVYYDKKFLTTTRKTLRYAPLGQKRPLPKGEGKTVSFFRYNNIAVSTTALTEGVNPNATVVTGQALTATVAEYGGFSQHSSLVKKTHIDRELAGISGLWGENAARTIDLLCAKQICSNGAYPLRADLSTTYSYSGTVTGTPTTTEVRCSALETNTNYGDTNDDLNQSVCIITSGTGYGQARPVIDYTASGGVMTFTGAAFDIAPVAGDTFVVASADTTLTTGEDLSTTNIARAVTILAGNDASPYDGQYYVGVLTPEMEEAIKTDTNWVNVMQYSATANGELGGLFTGEVGKWGGVRWVRTTQGFRFPQNTIGTSGASYGVGAGGGNYSATGDVHSVVIFGKEAFGVTTFVDEAGYIRPGVVVKNPGPGDTSNPLNRFSTVGWVLPFVAKALNPMFAVQIWCRV